MPKVRKPRLTIEQHLRKAKTLFDVYVYDRLEKNQVESFEKAFICWLSEKNKTDKDSTRKVLSPSTKPKLKNQEDWEIAIASIKELSNSPELPEAAFGFSQDILTKVESIEQQAKNRGEPTIRQKEALNNWLIGLKKWFRS